MGVAMRARLVDKLVLGLRARAARVCALARLVWRRDALAEARLVVVQRHHAPRRPRAAAAAVGAAAVAVGPRVALDAIPHAKAQRRVAHADRSLAPNEALVVLRHEDEVARVELDLVGRGRCAEVAWVAPVELDDAASLPVHAHLALDSGPDGEPQEACRHDPGFAICASARRSDVPIVVDGCYDRVAHVELDDKRHDAALVLVVQTNDGAGLPGVVVNVALHAIAHCEAERGGWLR